MPQDSGKANKASGWWRPIILIIIVLAVLVSAKMFGLAERIGDLRDWLQTLGTLGPLVFVVIYALAVTAALPGSALTVAAGALFGSLWGVVLVSIASTLGAGLAFLIARYFAREATARWLSNQEKFRKLDALTEEHGAIIVALTRLVPIFPFNPLNFGFGLTKVPFRIYLFWSWLCMLPGTVLYVVGADAITVGLTKGEIPWELIGILLAAGVCLGFLVRYARRRLQENKPTSQNNHPFK